MDIIQMIRKNIRELVPYSSARSEFKGKADVFLDANENPYDDLLDFNRYPDPFQKQLKQVIAKIRNVDIGSIFIGNGSDEIIDIIIRVFCEPGKDSILTMAPGFGMFKVAAAINDVGVKEIKLNKDYSLDADLLKSMITSDVKVIFLCSPNNPTGNSISREIVSDICDTTKKIVVIDEAYIDYSDKGSVIDLLGDYQNLIILQTMSKARGGAGLRVGMAFLHSHLVAYMNKVKMPYNISAINQHQALKLFSDHKNFQNMLQEVLIEKEKMWKKLNTYPSIQKVYPSDANFFLIKIEDAASVYKQLCDHKIIVRNLTNKQGCEDCLRITVGTPEQNEKLYKKLDSLLN